MVHNHKIDQTGHDKGIAGVGWPLHSLGDSSADDCGLPEDAHRANAVDQEPCFKFPTGWESFLRLKPLIP